MDIELIEEKLKQIVNDYTPATSTITELNTPISMAPFNLGVKEIVSIFLDIESAFNVEINALFDKPMDFTINSLAGAIKVGLSNSLVNI
ncbi:MAG: hypothetical protein FWC20_09435 [Oscillospiraceae bacterium]|nr:hypothetical protein [Oscillospiraceae bacterium]MCL2279611.1 hypothetical protein [Oscillospiraceae bacterium]